MREAAAKLSLPLEAKNAPAWALIFSADSQRRWGRLRRHSARSPARGFSGCANYTCYGAGQRVTRELLAEHSWRAQPERAREVFAAFRVLKHVHELRLLLHEAGRLELSPTHAAQRAQLLAELEPTRGFELESTVSFDVERARADVVAFMRALRVSVLSPPQERRSLRLVR
jgi:hypothetical protein